MSTGAMREKRMTPQGVNRDLRGRRGPRSRCACVWIGVFALVTTFQLAIPQPALAIENCVQRVSGREQLETDCLGDVRLVDGSLNLAGHILHGQIACEGDFCEVYSDPPGGMLTGLDNAGLVGIDAKHSSLSIEHIVITGFGTGVSAREVRARRVEVAGNSGFGINTLGHLELADSTIAMNGNDGLHSQGGQVVVLNSQITGNGGNGVRALKGARIENSSIAASGGDGVRNFSGAVIIQDSTVTLNGRDGVRNDDSDCLPSGTLELRSSSVEHNAHHPDCDGGDSRPCADVVACNVSHMTGSSQCTSSYRLQSGSPGTSWRVCSED